MAHMPKKMTVLGLATCFRNLEDHRRGLSEALGWVCGVGARHEDFFLDPTQSLS